MVNPFVRISPWLKGVVLLHLFIFGVLVNVISLWKETEPSWALLLQGILLILLASIKAAPVFFRGSTTGIIHPLVLPFLISAARSLGQEIGFLIGSVPAMSERIRLSWAVEQPFTVLLQLNIQATLIEIGWILIIYLTYFAFRNLKVSKFRVRQPANLVPRIVLASVAGIALLLLFFQMQGGLISWISSWGIAGRRDAMSDYGPILKLFMSLYFLPLLWYAYRNKRVYFNPLFYFITIAFIGVGFALTGSRSSVVFSGLSFLVVYIAHNRHIPVLAVSGGVFIALILFGLLGQVRSMSTYNRGAFDPRNINFNVLTSLEKAKEENGYRNSFNADIGVYGTVPAKHDYLFGKTYLSTVVFFIPRFIFPNKPHGAGFYTGRVIFRGSAGVPPGEQAEAYWNFGWFGLVIIPFLNGIYIRWIANLQRVNYRHPAWLVIYVIIITTAVSFTSLSLTSLVQKMIWIIPSMKLLKVI